MNDSTLDPEKCPPIGPEDEDLIKAGLQKAETSSVCSSISAQTDPSEERPLDDSILTPTRTLYVLRHNLFSKDVRIVDLTGQTAATYDGGPISDAFRDAARALAEEKANIAVPAAYQLQRKHWYSSTATLTRPSSPTPTTQLAEWKHGAASFSKAHISFPSSSPHCSHPLVVAPLKWYRRANGFVVDSVTYEYSCDSRLRANRITLVREVGGRRTVVARYAQRWGSYIAGGVLLVDTEKVDEVVAVLATCVMLRRMQQRAAERTKYSGGGGN